MSKRLLMGIIIVLLITNIATIITFNKENKIVINGYTVNVALNDAVANIDGEKITYKTWFKAIMEQHGKGELQSLIDREVVRQLADKHDIQIDDKVIQREISLLTSMQGVMTQMELKQLVEDWEGDIVYRYQLERLLAKDVSIPESETRQFYQRYGEQYNFTEAMQLSHIIVDNTEIAEKVKSELEQGASFASLAKEYSLDEETKYDGGYIGFIHTNSEFFPEGYEKVADEMEEHSISHPFKTNKGVAIIYLHEKLPSISFTYEELQPYIETELALSQLNQPATADLLWKQLDVEWIYDKKKEAGKND
ncbi:peptidylprolyl isomerase [Oceanobacillus senegalensis]|uniref:peptidylprolyl isomerase n=1 Tax=Oceanobacillus senegalensis TaxID=1936063 RepID=UPI000A30DF9B|nr:peptidylprolyl isomerase [Oceanobacillus senegalensis]